MNFSLDETIRDVRQIFNKYKRQFAELNKLTERAINERNEARSEALAWKTACLEAVAQRNEAREVTRIAVGRLSLYGGEFWQEELSKNFPGWWKKLLKTNLKLP